jgi:hypothetical protein
MQEQVPWPRALPIVQPLRYSPRWLIPVWYILASRWPVHPDGRRSETVIKDLIPSKDCREQTGFSTMVGIQSAHLTEVSPQCRGNPYKVPGMRSPRTSPQTSTGTPQYLVRCCRLTLLFHPAGNAPAASRTTYSSAATSSLTTGVSIAPARAGLDSTGASGARLAFSAFAASTRAALASIVV